MAGYSGTPLAKKLGIKAGTRVVAVGAPGGYAALLAPLPEGAAVVADGGGRERFVHLFTTRRAELERELPRLRDRLEKDGMLWVSWPKKASGVRSDVTEDVVRDVALASGMVDVKVCAVDDIWSGLKLVFRLADR